MAMERLGGLDTAFLYCETPGMHMHVCALALLDPGPLPAADFYVGFRSLLVDVIPSIPLMRRRLATVPLGIGRPFWVDDVDFDIDHHLHRVQVQPPGDDRSLSDLVGEVASMPLRRGRPLWETWVIEGLAGGRIAVLAKMHHSTVDGISAVNMMGPLFDLRPVRSTASPTRAWQPERPPRQLVLLGRGLTELSRSPLELIKLLPTTAARLGSTVWQLRTRRDDRSSTVTPFTAPRTSFNAALTPQRSIAFIDVSLADVKRVKDAYGVKVNDVVAAMVGGALRRYLGVRGELPDRPLIAAEPVSIHDQADGLVGATRLSVIFSTLATDRDDPVERLRAVAATNIRAKEINQMMGDDTLMRWSEHVWSYGFLLGARLYSGLRLADHHPVVYNLLLSNVPGPTVDLYLAGAKSVGLYPFGPVFEGSGLNVTVFSWGERVGFGIIACADLVPNVWDIVDALPAALEELVDSVKQQPPRRVRPPRPRAAAPPGGATKVDAREQVRSESK